MNYTMRVIDDVCTGYLIPIWKGVRDMIVVWACLHYLGVVPALGHSWYPEACCGGQDCRPVPCAEISVEGREYVWRGLRTHPTEFGFGKYASPDASCHVCVGHDKTWPNFMPNFIRCIYIPVRVS